MPRNTGGIEVVELSSGDRTVTLDAESAKRMGETVERLLDRPKYLSDALIRAIDRAICDAVDRIETGAMAKETVVVNFALAEDTDVGAVKIALKFRGQWEQQAEIYANGGQLKLPIVG